MAAAAAFELAPLGVPSGVPDAAAVMARAAGENFPVAARLLAPRERRALLAVYGFARLADELGDELRGDRLAALDWLARELDRAYAGQATALLLVRLQEVLAERTLEGAPRGGGETGTPKAPLHGGGRGSAAAPGQQPLHAPHRGALPREPFVRLIEANRVDQHVARYETWEQLQAYCELSANPVGELVLAIFGLRTPERVALSDRVCTGLQLTEHLQDVAEDARRGRVYLPAEDLARFGCSPESIAAMVAAQVAGAAVDRRDTGFAVDRRDAGGAANGAVARHALRETVAFELKRARELLWAAAPLAASIPRWRAKLTIAAFAGGGLAALEQIERAGFEVLPGVAPAGRWRRLRASARVLRRGDALR